VNTDREPSGLLIVDKPSGPTSHDVVAWVRRALGTRAVGHAGTLDPTATGVLVIAIGEGTKLIPYLTLDDKEYEFDLALGAETDTLDAAGTMVETAPVPELDAAMIDAALARFRGEQDQRAPAYSAIKVGGVALHRRARRGEAVEAPTRRVMVHALDRLSIAPLSLRVHASKGFYVRSLGRDLARALGTVGHVTRLRRLASGPFRVTEAVDGAVVSAARTDPAAREQLRARLLPIEQGLRGLPIVMLDERGEADARAGRLVRVANTADGVVALVSSCGALVAIGERRDDAIAVRRGFRPHRVDD
jgi:tRNA pseudouridine55 synthase